MMPMDFWASLAPCEKARKAEVTHCERRSVRFAFGLAPWSNRPMSRWMRKPTPKPMIGEMIRPISTFVTPVTCPWSSSPKPQTTWDGPTATTTAPATPPVSACEDEDGMPNHHVPRFQTIAPMMPQKITVTALTGSTPSRLTNLPIVFATAVPPRMGPRNSKVATMTTACTGVIARDAMTVATMFDASWKPLV